jgi:hypothetical protein
LADVLVVADVLRHSWPSNLPPSRSLSRGCANVALLPSRTLCRPLLYASGFAYLGGDLRSF